MEPCQNDEPAIRATPSLLYNQKCYGWWAVLGFQVEYHSLISEEDQEVIVTQLNKGKLPDDALQQEKLLPTELYETDEHIRTMLQKSLIGEVWSKSSR